MPTGKVMIIGMRDDGRPLRGQDVRIVMVDRDGKELLIPALSLNLRVGSRHETLVATIEVPAVLVNLDGVELRTEAVVASGGPESQWEDAIGKVQGDTIADADAYTDPHVVVGSKWPTMGKSDLNEDALLSKASIAPSPMDELDKIIAGGLPDLAPAEGVLVSPVGPESMFEAGTTPTRPEVPPAPAFTLGVPGKDASGKVL